MASFMAEKVAHFATWQRRTSYPFSGGKRIEVERLGSGSSRIAVTYRDGSSVLKVNHFDTKKVPWLACNPFCLIGAGPVKEFSAGIQRSWADVNRRTSDPTSSIAVFRDIVMLTNEADTTYYGIALLAKKIQEGKINQREGLDILRNRAFAAFAESDAPMLAYINGYLVQLRATLGPELMLGIEKDFPGITTENLAGNFGHILRL